MTVYLYGKLTQNKFYTPLRTYSHTTSFPKNFYVNTYVPCKFITDIEVFYMSPIFNTYVIAEEEKVTRMFSVDKKHTIIKCTGLKPNTLYTCKVVEESSACRVCTIFNYSDDCKWVGMEVTGKLEVKKGKPALSTHLGVHPVVLQNNLHGKKIKARLWKVDGDKMSFVEVANSVNKVVSLSVDKETDKLVMVSDANIRGIIMKQDLVQPINDKKVISCYVKEEMLGFYIFGEVHDLKIGDYIDARVVGKKDKVYELKYQVYSGFIDKENMNIHSKHDKTLRGKVIEISDKVFKLTQIENISVPFDFEPEEESEVVETQIGKSNLDEIFCKVQKLVEYKKFDEVKEVYYKNIMNLSSEDRDQLSLVYCNFMEYVNLDVVKELRKISKHCSLKFLEQVGINTNLESVLEYCFDMTKSRHLYKKYLGMVYKSGSGIEKVIKKHHEFMDVSIDCIYECENNPRHIAEKVVGLSKIGWTRYIEREADIEYKRLLFRRVVAMNWKVSEMKEWYRKWMQFEKDICGNVDEVRARAKEFVQNVRNKDE